MFIEVHPTVQCPSDTESQQENDKVNDASSEECRIIRKIFWTYLHFWQCGKKVRTKIEWNCVQRSDSDEGGKLE